MSASLLARFAAHAPTAFPAGAVLIAEADAAPRLFVLAAGTLEIVRGDVVVATIATPGAVVGEMAVLLGRPATASVRAATLVTAYVVDAPEAFFAQNPAVLFEIARTLAQRLDATTAFLVESRHRFAGDEDLGFLEDVFSLLGRADKPATLDHV